MPHIPGADFSGSIVALGEDVSGWVAGQPVTANPSLWCGHCTYCLAGQQSLCDTFAILGEHVRGSFAEFVVMPARNLVAVPDGFPMKQAAAAPTVAVTTWRMLVTRGQLRPGETVLIVGAGGGVNSFSIPLAKMLGATVWVVAGGAAKAQQATRTGRGLGHRPRGRAELVEGSVSAQQQTGRRRGRGQRRRGDLGSQPAHAAAKGGRLLTVGGTTGYTGQTPINIVFGRQVSIIGSTMGSQREFEDVMRLIFAGKLAVPIDRVYPLRRGASG